MSAPKHTPGPWMADSERTGAYTIGTRSTEVARLETENGDRDYANAARIVACVNSLEGIAHPECIPALLQALADYENGGRRDYSSVAKAFASLAMGDK